MESAFFLDTVAGLPHEHYLFLYDTQLVFHCDVPYPMSRLL